MPTNYKHTQLGWSVVGTLLGVVVVLAIVFASIRAPGYAWFVMAVPVLLIPLFSTFTVTVERGWIDCRFGIGLIRRRISLDDVVDAKRVRNQWYYGWGVRLTPHGWMWNISGLDAVELTLKNGRKFRIGTDEPERLLEAIGARLPRQPVPSIR